MPISEKPIAHLVWLQGRRAADDVEDYYEVARPGDKSVDGSDPFPVYASPSDEAWTCAARKQGTTGGNDPADCNWPMCGCDPHADKVIAALEETGAIPASPSDAERHERAVPDGWQLVPKVPTREMIDTWRIDQAQSRSLETSYIAMITASPSPPAAVQETVAATHRHKKRGSEYALIGIGKMQAENWRELIGEQNLVEGEEVGAPVDMREVAIYRSSDDGSLWVRPREEFEDGRFETIRSALSLSQTDPAPEIAAKATEEYRLRRIITDLQAERQALLQALKPFAACADEIDYGDKERDEPTPDEEWAKFRLLVGDYRRARSAMIHPTTTEGK